MHVNIGHVVNKSQLRSAIAKLVDDVTNDVGISYIECQQRPDGPDIVLELEVGAGSHARFVVELCADPRLARVAQAAERALSYADRIRADAAVAVPRLGPKLKQALKDRGVGYLSLDGQVHLGGQGVLIDRRAEVVHQPSPEPSGNLFADKSSLVLRFLLGRPAASIGIRDLAARLGLSPGLVSRVVSKLKSDGYLIEENGFGRLVGRDTLLADWADFYRRRAKRQREHRRYMHARDIQTVMRQLAKAPLRSDAQHWGLSFHAGASLVQPFAFFSEVHILVGDASDEDVASFSQSLGIEPSRDQANVVLVHPYYQHSWSYGLREIEGLPVVSDIQLYLDLSVYPRRGAEQAERIRERLLAPENTVVHE